MYNKLARYIVIGCVFEVWSVCGFLLDSDGTSVSALLSALRQEKQARAILETSIQTLRDDLQYISTGHEASKCTCPPSTAVAFSATLTRDINNLGDNQTLLYDKVITNVGGGYDSRHGAFTAPVGGIYKFTFSVLQGTASIWIGVELVRNGNAVGRVKVGDYGYLAVGTNIVNIHLDAGDDIWVRHISNTGNHVIPAQDGGFAMFTGHLVASD